MNIMEKKNTALIKEFDRYIREHIDFTDRFPSEAFVIMQLEGDEEFNQWSRKLAESYSEKGQSVVYVKIKKLNPFNLVSRN